jgi:hypothetical protein
VTVACWAVRLPGIRKATAVAATAVLIAIMIARIALGIGVPPIGGQSSGYLDRSYSGAELRARFGEFNPAFIGYNVISGASSVLFSEPQLGVFRTMTAARRDHVPPGLPIDLVSSTLTTVLLGWYLVFRLGRRPRAWTDHEKLAVVAAAVIALNTLLVPTYIKNEILGVAGMFYAVAVFVALHELLHVVQEIAQERGAVLASTLTVAVAVCGALWTIRAAGIGYDLQRASFYARTEWVLQVPRSRFGKRSETRHGLAVVERLRREAIDGRRPGWTTLPRWGESLWLVE